MQWPRGRIQKCVHPGGGHVCYEFARECPSHDASILGEVFGLVLPILNGFLWTLSGTPHCCVCDFSLRLSARRCLNVPHRGGYEIASCEKLKHLGWGDLCWRCVDVA